MTYIKTAEGWLYLAVLIDLYSRRLVGWHIDDQMESELPLNALKMALKLRKYKSGLIHHTDQGSQYCSQIYQKELKKHELICSMSRAGQCLDNAVAESFFSSLKKELVYAKDLKYATKREAHQNVVDDLLWFNQERIHSSCQNKSPIHYENQMSRFLP